MKILSFGEILWDVYPDKKYLGGAPLNFAAHMAKHGEEVYILSAVGEDAAGEEAIAQIRRWGVFTKYITISRKTPTGKCLITLDENSVPSYHLLENVAYDHIAVNELQDNFDVLYFGTLALRGDANFQALKEVLRSHSFQEIFVDVNIRPPAYTKEKVMFAVENATILKVSIEELPVLCEIFDKQNIAYSEFAKMMSRSYEKLHCVMITLGDQGAYVWDDRERKEYFCDAAKVEVCSTVGAGDSFSAAFLSKYMRGFDVDFCLSYATKVAAYVVSQFNAVPEYAAEDFE